MLPKSLAIALLCALAPPVAALAQPQDSSGALSFRHYRLRPPAGSEWTLVRRDESRAQWRRRTGKEEDHSIELSSRTAVLGWTFDSASAFLVFVETIAAKSRAGLRLGAKRERFRLRRRSGSDCVEHRFQGLETDTAGSAPPFVVSGRELYCLHPNRSPALLITVAYRQRHRSDRAALMVEQEIDAVFRGLAFTP